jgi:RNA polymerase primary sigma factor
VGKKFGVTRERIRQLQNIAVAKLRAALSEKEAPTPKPVTASTTIQILGSTNRA